MPPRPEDAKAELRKRVLTELYRRDPAEYRRVVRTMLLATLHAKQREVIDDVAAGNRFLSLCTSRRAGKTTTIAVQVVLSLLEAGHNQTVLFIATTLWKGRDLVWPDLSRMIKEYHLPWEMKEHLGRITTPEGATFVISGLNKKGQAEGPRGADVILAAIDECQDQVHLLKPLLTAIGPALSGRGGILMLAGTPGYQPTGIWHDIAVNGHGGFKNHHFTILDNVKLPRDPEVILAEELARNGWTEQTPEFLREYKGLWVPDDSTMVFAFDAEKHSILDLPDNYSSKWIHVMGIDLGFNDHSAWTVMALDPQSQHKIILHTESHPRIFADQAVEITRNLVRTYGLTRVVCDPAAGGKGFYEAFNAQHGRELGVTIRGANKVDKKGRVGMFNSELRAGRLKLLRPNADALAQELQTLRYRSREACEFLTSATVRDDITDTAMYALAEIAPISASVAATAPSPLDPLLRLFQPGARTQGIVDLLT